MRFGLYCVTLCAAVIVPPLSLRSGDDSRARIAQRAPVSRASYVPLAASGTLIPVVLKNTINSHSAYVEEAIYCETSFPIVSHDHVLIPAGSFIKGEITEVSQPGHVRGKAQLGARFDTLILPSGLTFPIRARVFSIAGYRIGSQDQIEQSKTEGGDPKENGEAMAASGAENVVIDASGLGGTSMVMAASEGIGGLALMLVTRGKTILFRPGTTLELQLTEALSLTKAVDPNSAVHVDRLASKSSQH